MARYRGPRLRIIRRLGELPGLTNKSTIRMNPPGEHGSTKKQGKLSQYGLRLQEKQKLRYHFGLTEKQLMNYVKQAKAMKGPTGELLLALLEMRLDNIIFRLGFVPTIAAARQLISHGHILVNQQKVDIASYQCQPKDIISVKDKRQSKQLINNYLTDSTNQKTIPVHLSLNGEYLVGIVNNLVDPQFLGLNVNELLIVEYYSRKI
jgi:small subunit ribosomal protein S4|uniref:ribosomal protein S4 n=1 Tax=Tetraselmis suecica TaxID=270643 RepID=UPI0021D5314B|nr:ribosomal protein S4 [Tetraselmis suecica]UXF58518.1 ribosomal protein S4 [Tetraselmis suecica]